MFDWLKNEPFFRNRVLLQDSIIEQENWEETVVDCVKQGKFDRKQIQKELYELPIEYLNTTIRAYRVLKTRHYKYVGDCLTLTLDEMNQWEKVNKKTKQEIWTRIEKIKHSFFTFE